MARMCPPLGTSRRRSSLRGCSLCMRSEVWTGGEGGSSLLRGQDGVPVVMRPERALVGNPASSTPVFRPITEDDVMAVDPG